MARRKIKKIKNKVQAKKTNLTGFPEIDEFIETCLAQEVEKDDELLKNLKAVVSAVGVKKTVLILRNLVDRLFDYDDFYNLLMDDIETNLLQFESMKKMSMISDEPEIQKVHKNMMVMAARLDEFARQMEEMSGRKMRKKTQPMKVETMDQFSDRVIQETEKQSG